MVNPVNIASPGGSVNIPLTVSQLAAFPSNRGQQGRHGLNGKQASYSEFLGEENCGKFPPPLYALKFYSVACVRGTG